MHTFQLLLKDLKQKIRKLIKEEFKHIQKSQERLQACTKQVQKIMITQGRSEALVEEDVKLVTHIEEWRKHEEILWKHKLRFQWLREGERNTRLFHKEMVKHKQHNQIFSPLDPRGNMLVKHEEIKPVGKPFSKYFFQIQTLTGPRQLTRSQGIYPGW